MESFNIKPQIYSLFISFVFFVLLTPLLVSAQTATLVSDGLGLGEGNLDTYFNNLFNLALTVGAILAVIIIATAGIQYMTTDAFMQKSDGKKRIQQAVLGLLMLMAVFLFFKTIDPDILKLNFNLKQVNLDAKKPTSQQGSATKNIVKNQATIIKESVDKQEAVVMKEGGYTKVLKEYNAEEFNSLEISDSEKKEILLEEWADDCEATDADATFEHITAISTGGTRFVCVK